MQTKRELVALSNGFICCTLRGDLVREISKFVMSTQFDYVVIESTGIAEPKAVAQAFCFDPATAQLAQSTEEMLWMKARLDTCAMQAVSHYSYHTSNGRSVLCDLQGGVYQDGVILTDPVVMLVSRCYSPTDLGLEGINTFFANHTCNEYCRSNWRTLHNPVRYHSASKGTTVEHVPTRRSCPQLSAMAMTMAMGAIYE